MKTAISNAMPFALVIIGMIMSVRLFLDLPTQQAQTVMYLLLIFHNYVSSDKELYSVYEIKNFYLRINGRWDVWSIIYTSVSFFHLSAMTAGNA